MGVPVSLLDRFRSRPRQTPPGDQLIVPRQHPLRVLRADGQRIDLTARDAGTRITLVRQDWQTDAWAYRDMIGELRYAQRLLARSVAKARFFAAEIRPYPDSPVELTGNDHGLDKRLAADAVENLNRLPLDDGPDGFVAMFTENLETAGEAWIHGEPDTGEGEQWTIRSISEIIGSGSQIMLAELPTISTVGQRPIDPTQEELLRCWTRHPRWGQLADSPLRAMLDVLEEVVLTGREMRAAARSRIASNGVLLIPTSLSLLRTRDEGEDLLPESVLEDDFMADFTEALTAPIRDEGSPGSVVPLILRGDAEALKEVRHLGLTRDDAAKLMERLQGAVLRMLQGLDIQPEQVQGTGKINHWGGWLLEASNIRHQVDPMCGIVGGCLTKGFLRPALRTVGHDPAQVARVGIWYDLTGLVESPDRSQAARDAWDRDGISNDAFREAMGFDDEHAPDPKEHLIRLLSRGRLTPQAVPLVAALSGVDLSEDRIQQALRIAVGIPVATPRIVRGEVTTGAPISGQSTANPAAPGQIVPEKPVPTPPSSDSSPGLTAAGNPAGWLVDVEAGRALADIDAALLDRVLTACDAAVARAVERAGGRARNAVRNAIRKDPTLAASIEGVDVSLVAATLGREVLGSFVSVPDLLSGAYQRVTDQVGKWFTQAARSVGDAVVRLRGLNPQSLAGRLLKNQVETRLAVYRPAAQDALAAVLDAAAERALFHTDPLSPDAEEHTDTLITPSEIARVLVIAGGGTPGRAGDMGYATGAVTRDALTEKGGVLLGWEWQYRPQVPRDAHFGPHVELDGARFTSWTDPKLRTNGEADWVGEFFRPGDHPHCRCSAAMITAYPKDGSADGVEQLRSHYIEGTR